MTVKSFFPITHDLSKATASSRTVIPNAHVLPRSLEHGASDVRHPATMLSVKTVAPARQ